MNRNTIIIAIVVLVVLVGGFMIMQNSQTETKTETTPTLAPTDESMESTGSSMMEGDVQAFTVEGGAFFFKPNEIRVKKGDKVKITFTNTGGMHDFVLDEFDVKTEVIGAGKSETVEFVADKAGTFEFYCNVGNHRAQGMKGTLVVE